MDDRALFGQICSGVLCARYEEELKLCKANVRCSPQHYKRVSEILDIKVRPHYTISKRAIALIVAAAFMVLTACAAYIYREELKGLFVEKGDKGDYLYSNEEQAYNVDSIEEVYTLTYIPEGFEVTSDDSMPDKARYELKNSEGKYITYNQTFLNSLITIDKGESKIITIPECAFDIYFSFNGSTYIYVWNDGKFNNVLSSQIELSDGELLKIIEGIKVK